MHTPTPGLPEFDYVKPASLAEATYFLAQAAHTVASYQLRTRATVVGNICNGSPAGDTTGACIVLGAVLHVHGVDGRRVRRLHRDAERRTGQ